MKTPQFASLEHIDEQNSTNINQNAILSQESPNKHKRLMRGSIALFILALILVIALIISMVVIFIIGANRAQSDQNSYTVSSTIATSSIGPLYEPCKCGCPSTEPLLKNETKMGTARIVNGENVEAHSWPWQIFLIAYDPVNRLTASCGATLLSKRHVLTAAHCVHGYLPPYILLFSGLHARNFNISRADIHNVNKVYVHEGYNARAHNDLAILTTIESFRFDSNVSPICLSTPDSPFLQADEELVAIGWGRISGQPGTPRYPEYLQQVKVAYLPTSNPNCSGIFESKVALHPGQMCAGSPGHNVCRGDSGGPLMRRLRLADTETYYWEQVGIASLSKDCGWNSTWPDIYISASYYYDWILNTVKRAV